jgi:hypothetical protein
MADLRTATAFDRDPPFATESQVETALANGLLFATFYLPSATGTAAYEEIVRIDRSDRRRGWRGDRVKIGTKAAWGMQMRERTIL